MRTWLLSTWDRLSGSFWFVPMLMVLGAVAVSLISLQIDGNAAGKDNEEALSLGWTFTRGPEGSRAVLSTVAGSMITIASVCFSITVVALQQASSQFGPRLLHNFMRDRGNQITLGTFIAAFTYCLLILRTVNGTDGAVFVPHLSVTIGLGFAVAGVVVLIYFIHHAATTMQAEYVINNVATDLGDALDRLYPKRVGEPRDAHGELPAAFATESVPVAAETSDYVQAVDGGRLMGLAVKHDLVLRVDHRPGEFVIAGNPLLRAWPPHNVTDAILDDLRGAFFLDARRTLVQDVEFAVDQLVEVALRALSPGINDPFTAMSCIDRLGAALCQFAGKDIPSRYRHDDQGKLRLVTDAVTAGDMVDAALRQIRQAARTNAAVTCRLLETVCAVAPRVGTRDMRAALLEHAERIYQNSREGLSDAADRAAVAERHRAALELLTPKPELIV